MKKGRRLPWIAGGLIVLLVGGGIWIKQIIDDQPTEHPDPGIPDVEGLPDPEDVE